MTAEAAEPFLVTADATDAASAAAEVTERVPEPTVVTGEAAVPAPDPVTPEVADAPADADVEVADAEPTAGTGTEPVGAVAGAVAEVAAWVADDAADVTGAAAEGTAAEPVPVLEPVLVELAAPVLEAGDAEPVGVVTELVGAVGGAVELVAAEPLPEPVPPAAADVAAEVAEPAPEPVADTAADFAVETTELAVEAAEPVSAAGVTGPEPEPAEVTGAAADVAVAAVGALDAGAEVAEPAGSAGVGDADVAACACRENASNRTRIPAATMTACTAWRAMRRAVICAMSNSRDAGMNRTGT